MEVLFLSQFGNIRGCFLWVKNADGQGVGMNQKVYEPRGGRYSFGFLGLVT